MKKHLIAGAIGVFLVISQSTFAQGDNYGAKIDGSGTISMKELVAKMEGKEELNVKVEGKVAEVCQTKGDGSNMRVTFKDYGFFVPKNISGKTVVISGKAYINTTTVEELKHYAEDAGKSKEEIAKITTAEKELAFEADGVIVR